MSLLDDYYSENHTRVINVPEGFEIPEDPVRDPILDCENEIEEAIHSTSKSLGLFFNGLKRYISTTDELPEFFEKFYKEKELYSIKFLRHQTFKSLVKAMKIQDEPSELTKKINCCALLVDKYLDMHPDMENDCSRISLDMATEIIDYDEVNEMYEDLLKKEKAKLEEYYSVMTYNLSLRNPIAPIIEPEETNVPQKKKKGFFSFFNF